MSFTNAFETTILNWGFTADSATRPTSWYVALYTVAPNDTGGGTELRGNAYVREASTFSVTGDTASNTGAIEWAAATGSWGTVVAIGVFDAVSAGNLLAYGNLTSSKTIQTGDIFRIPAGDLDITLD